MINKKLGYQLAALSLVAATTVGCASTPPAPTNALNDAENAIYRAEEAGASQYASLKLREARDNLNAAEDAARGDEKEDMAKARRLAERAQADAQVAMAEAERERAAQANQEIQDSIDAMQSEINRNMGS